ncbi:MAG: SDR family NAD(P)-dependent oxidoreductase [Proteobacteria bacterium]|nr:SDR family NAD(P)-dependent oxidoreductase [Pseudomonadota bacterium]
MSGASADKVCIVTGVGPGTGTALVERFAAGGYRVAMLARNAERLEALAGRIGDAHPFPCDVADSGALSDAVAQIRAALGAPSVVVHNAVGGAFGSFLDVDAKTLERNFHINTMALFHLARATVPDMLEAGFGAILATGNTAAYRGKAPFAGFAPTKAAQRILIESIARSVGPRGVHAAYVAVDAVIDVPWTRERFADQPDDFFCKPADIADECFHIAHQPRSAWASEVVIRPFGESW